MRNLHALSYTIVFGGSRKCVVKILNGCFTFSHHLKAIALHHVGSRYSRVVVFNVFLTNRAP